MSDPEGAARIDAIMRAQARASMAQKYEYSAGITYRRIQTLSVFDPAVDLLTDLYNEQIAAISAYTGEDLLTIRGRIEA